MGLSGRKINATRHTQFISAADFNLKLPTLRVNSSGAIGGTMELGLSADANTATLEGGAGITAQRDLLTNPTNVYASINDPTVVIEKVASTIAMVGCKMNATSDILRHVMAFPRHWATHKPIKARVHAMCASISPSELGVISVGITPQNAGVAWGAGPTGATFTTQVVPVGTTLYPIVSAWATPSYSWAQLNEDYPSPACMLIYALRSTFTITGDFWLTGVEFEYTPKL